MELDITLLQTEGHLVEASINTSLPERSLTVESHVDLPLAMRSGRGLLAGQVPAVLARLAGVFRVLLVSAVGVEEPLPVASWLPTMRWQGFR